MIKFPTDIELIAENLTPCNKLQVLKVPLGVTLFIQHSNTFDIDKAIPLLTGSVINVKEGNDLSLNENLYIFTFGTATNEEIEIKTYSINRNSKYLELEQNSNLATFSENTEQAITNLSKNIDPLKCQDLVVAATSTEQLNVSDWKYIRFNCDSEFKIALGLTEYPFVEDELDISRLDNLTFKNYSASEITINILGA